MSVCTGGQAGDSAPDSSATEHTADWWRAIGYRYAGTPGDRDFLVLGNCGGTPGSFPVADIPGPSTWFVMSDGERATADGPGLSARPHGNIDVPAGRGMILMSESVND